MKSLKEFFTNLTACCSNLQNTADRDGTITLIKLKTKVPGLYKKITQFLNSLLKMENDGLVLLNNYQILVHSI